MSVKQAIQERIEKMSQADLEWLDALLSQHEYPDTRVERTPEELAEIKSLLADLAAPMTPEETKAFNQAMNQ
jgi:hypothetical protein